jgi:exonuclease SbcC
VRVREIQLENIRSHVESTITFEEGFNCIVGGLGCGKSSVLYAIDFALIGDPLGRSYDYLLREGADKGKITLRFTHGGKAYTISRTLQRHDSHISQDMDQLKLLEEEELIAGTRNEAVTEQLKAITGLDKDLFREIVWVRQEHLKELLDVTPRQRQRR